MRYRTARILLAALLAAVMFRSLGGYGELTLNVPEHAPAVADLRRFVLYVGHHFSESWRFHGEVEVEHGITSSVDVGSIEILQAYIDSFFSRTFVAHPEFRRYSTTLGLTYKPIQYIALKLDYRRQEFGAGAGFNEAVSAIA